MPTPKTPLAESLIFRAHPIGDPPPWVLEQLNREQIIQVAQIHLDLQKSILAANLKAAETMSAVLKNA
jgi:hypothetical protein